MTIDKKLRTIRRNCYKFDVLEDVTGRLVGRILLSSNFDIYRYSGAYVYHEDMIGSAYKIIRRMVFNEIHESTNH